MESVFIHKSMLFSEQNRMFPDNKKKGFRIFLHYTQKLCAHSNVWLFFNFIFMSSSSLNYRLCQQYCRKKVHGGTREVSVVVTHVINTVDLIVSCKRTTLF